MSYIKSQKMNIVNNRFVYNLNLACVRGGDEQKRKSKYIEAVIDRDHDIN
jgi:hypothetical protein